MEKLYEIYLTKSYVTKIEWLELIKTIANFCGHLKRFKIIVTNEKNEIRYYIQTKCNLPITINNLNSFLLKEVDKTFNIKHDITLLSLPKIGSNLIDLINIKEIKNKGNLVMLEIKFWKLHKDKIKTSITYFLNKNGYIKKYKILYAIPATILSIDFENNKRYFYKKAPNYLDISKILHLLNSDSNNALLKVDTFPYLQGSFYLNQHSFNFDKHSIILGSSGSGKSKFLSLLINNIYKNNELKNKYRVVVIDPHASLENDIGSLGNTIDFINDNCIDLFINNNEDIIATTENLLDLLKSLFRADYNSKMERILRHSIYLLLANSIFNFLNLKKLLLDMEYRNNLIKISKDKIPLSITDFFLTDFNELKTKSYTEAISPIIAFIDEVEMIPVFNNNAKYSNLTDTINNNFLTLFSLNRTKLGDKVTKTIAGLIMSELLLLIQNGKVYEHIIFVVDEVAVVENPILAKFLAEARKYNLSLILVSQYFNQISENLKNAIFANTINYYIFRVSKMDANILVDNFNMKIPLNDTREEKIKVLTELNNRECVVRIARDTLFPAFKAYTLDYLSNPRIKKDEIEHLFTNIQNNDKPKYNFNINTNINLKDILKNNSTSRKVVK